MSQKRTNVRSQAPMWLRAGMSGLEAVWPPLAASVAERLLLSPLHHRTPRRERPLIETARAMSLPWWPRHQRLAGYAWGSGPPILLVHGWAGRTTQLGAFVPPLVAAGYSVLGYDLPAHGRSDGEQASLFDFRDALVAIAREHGPFAGVIAHSMGGAAATLALGAGLETGHLVLIAAPASLRTQTRRFAATLGVSEATYERVTERLENRMHARIDSMEVEALAPKIDAITLVVHDDGDEEVLPADGARVAAALGARLHRTIGLGHRKILRDPTVVATVAQFLTGRALEVALPDLPNLPNLDDIVERELFNRDLRR